MKMVLQFWPLRFHSLVNTAGVFVTKVCFPASTPTPKGRLCSSSAGDSWLRCFRCLRLAIQALAQSAGEPSGPGAPGSPASCVGRRDVWGCHLLEVQRPCAGTEAGGTPDCTQFVVCRTVISPPSSREVPVQVAGWMGLPGTDHSRVGFHTEGRFETALSALQGPRSVCACPYLGVASAPRASSWEGR